MTNNINKKIKIKTELHYANAGIDMVTLERSYKISIMI